jgi:hypothetical protein
MMKIFQSKKGDSSTLLKQIGTIIVLTLVFFILLNVIFPMISQAENFSQEEMCTMAVFLKHNSNLEDGGFFGIKQSVVDGMTETSLNTFCYVFNRQLPLDEYKKTREGVSKSIGDLAVDCWKMFGEGNYKSTFQGDWGRMVGDKPCHVCYAFSILDKGINVDRNYISGQSPILMGNDLNYFFDSNSFYVEPDYHERNCFDGWNDKEYVKEHDSDFDGFSDRNDPDCTDDPLAENPKKRGEFMDSNCEYNGGVCIKDAVGCDYVMDSEKGLNKDAKIFYGISNYQGTFKEYSDSEWRCKNSNEVCCVPSTNVYTYRGFIQKNDGLLRLATDSDNPDSYMDFKAGVPYGVAIVQPVSNYGGDDGEKWYARLDDPGSLISFAIGGIYGFSLYHSYYSSIDDLINQIENSKMVNNYHIYIDKYENLEKYCEITESSERKTSG